MKRSLFTGIVLGLALAATAAGPGQAAPDALTIIKDSDRTLKPQSEKISYRMSLVAPDGRVEQTRTFITYYKQAEGVQRTLQKFLSPPVLAGTGLLIVDRGAPDPDIWMYLPTTRRIRRIAGRDKRNRYMGTEFAFEDFQGYRIAAYNFTLVGTKPDSKGRSCWVIEAVASTPSEKAATGYSKKRYWIEEKTLYPVRIEYYAKDGDLEKVFLARDLHQVDHYWRPRREEIKNLRSGRSTRLTLEDIQLNLPLADRFVSKRYLRSD